MGRVKSVVEAALDLYSMVPVDDAYRVAISMSKLTTILKLSVTLATEEIKKNPEAIAVVIISKLFPTWSGIGDYAKNICEWVVYFSNR